MGVLGTLLVNAALTAFTLGALKHYGAIEIHPQTLRNDYLQFAFIKTVSWGEAAYVKTKEFKDEIYKTSKKS